MARGGAGLVITETPAMEWPLLEEGDRRFRIDDDKYLKQLGELSAEVHKYGVPIFTQLYHRGPWSGIYALAAQPVAASAVTYPSPFDVHDEKPPHVLTLGEIEALVERFASGTARLRQAGWDGIEINAGADHLFSTFLSRFWNRRDDRYGPQSMANRTRFLVEVVREIKKCCGEDFPVQVLINGIEVGVPDEKAQSLEEGREIARILQAAGVELRCTCARTGRGCTRAPTTRRTCSTRSLTSRCGIFPGNWTGAATALWRRCPSPRRSRRRSPCRS